MFGGAFAAQNRGVERGLAPEMRSPCVGIRHGPNLNLFLVQDINIMHIYGRDGSVNMIPRTSDL